MRDFPRPRIVCSKCLEFDACRYNGAMIPNEVVRLLRPYADFVAVCPEVEIGLGVPRPPIRIVRADRGLRLIQPETGKDVTAEMADFVSRFLGRVGRIDGFVLKSRSPSCGMKDVKIHSDAQKGGILARGGGFFGGVVAERFAGAAVEDEGRLTNLRVREHFLTKLFSLASFRAVEAVGMMRRLVEFHTDNKLLLMAYGQKHLKALGKLVANPDRRPAADVFAAYRAGLEAAMAGPPRATACINVLMHAMGYFSGRLTSREKAFFLDSLRDFRERRTPLSVPAGIMKSFMVRFEEPYLGRQTFFAPYPETMLSVADSGKGREP